MEVKKIKPSSYNNHVSLIKSGQIGRLYIYHGDEWYLLELCLKDIRAALCPNGLTGFNYKRFEGKSLSVDDIEDAVDTLPVFADRTLIEIHDFDIFKSDSMPHLCDILSDLPDYVCVVFVYNTIEYKPDGRLKIHKEILKHTDVIEFVLQDQDKLVRWIKLHYQDAGKSIRTSDAEYLAFITGGSMSALNGEIEKTAAYAKQVRITRNDIDAVVTPVLETVAYKLTDALVNNDNKRALRILDELLQMREAPHKLIFIISLKMRQLLTARIYLEGNLNKSAFMEICGIKHDFQARTLFSTVRKTTLSNCRNAVIACSETALELNSSADPESRIIELVVKLASSR